MPRSTVWLARAVVGAMAVTVLTGVTAEGSGAPHGSHAGPPYHFVTELMGQFKTIPLKDQGLLSRTPHGYRFRTGQQNSHLVITRVHAGLRFVDTGTKRFKWLTPACRRQKVRRGIAAVCRVPAATTVRKPLLVEVWPRLGNDITDTSSLSARFAVTVLADGGHDVTRFGAGRDFFNGHSGRDVVWGGPGNDWIRAGLGDDVVQGGSGNDYIVGMEGRDAVRAGGGNDRVGGGDGSDRLWGDAGSDFLLCGTGRDTARAGAQDRVFYDCESVHRG